MSRTTKYSGAVEVAVYACGLFKGPTGGRNSQCALL